MNAASIAPDVAQAVARFAEAVRARLADLTADERDELAGGLEADLADLVEERGVEALGDPVAYARELRSAAGLDPVTGKLRGRRPVGETVAGWLDVAHDRWDRAVTGLPGAPWELVVSLRPVWWVLRAYVAVQAIDLVSGNGWTMALMPTLSGFEIPLLVVATVLSVQMGRGRLWPAGAHGVLPRVVLLGLNLLALALTPAVFGKLPTGVSWETVGQASYPVGGEGEGLAHDGVEVSNVYPYDADGQPLVGVQLFDQNGAPLKVGQYVQGGDFQNWAYPWSNVNGEVWNSFPMPEAPYDDGEHCCDRMPSPWTSDTPPAFLRPPFDQVPAVTIPDAAYGDRTAQGAPDEKSQAEKPEANKSGAEKSPAKKPGR